MSPDHLAGWEGVLLLGLALGSMVCLFLIARVHRGDGLFAHVTFRPPRVAREPPLWGSGEVALGVAAWFAFDIASALLVRPLEETLAEPVAFLLVFAVSKVLTCVFIIFILVERVSGQPLSALGFACSRPRHFLVAAVLHPVVFLPIALLGALWNGLLSAFGHQPELQEPVEILAGLVRDGEWPGFSCYALAAVVIAPLAEEVLFRGLLFGWLRRSLGFAGAALVSGVLFAAVHLSLTAAAQLAALGFFLAYLYERSGSLWVAIFFHALFNAGTVWLVALESLVGGA